MTTEQTRPTAEGVADALRRPRPDVVHCYQRLANVGVVPRCDTGPIRVDEHGDVSVYHAIDGYRVGTFPMDIAEAFALRACVEELRRLQRDGVCPLECGGWFLEILNAPDALTAAVDAVCRMRGAQ